MFPPDGDWLAVTNVTGWWMGDCSVGGGHGVTDWLSVGERHGGWLVAGGHQRDWLTGVRVAAGEWLAVTNVTGWLTAAPRRVGWLAGGRPRGWLVAGWSVSLGFHGWRVVAGCLAGWLVAGGGWLWR